MITSSNFNKQIFYANYQKSAESKPKLKKRNSENNFINGENR